MVKLVNNSFRDLSFAFANELARVCSEWDLDAVKIIKAANEGYPRNPVPLPSPGVGGICLRKDPYLYASSQKGVKVEQTLSYWGRRTNEAMPKFVADQVTEFLRREGKEKAKIFLVGFAFKGEPETSDIRSSTSLDILSELKQTPGVEIFGFDPVLSLDELRNFEINAVTVEEGFHEADAILILNNHRSYLDFPLSKLLPKTRKKALFMDTWSLFSRTEIEQVEGVIYRGISGRN